MIIKATICILIVLYAVSFFLHFVWEMWQIPFYRNMLTANHWAAVVRCSQATIGDGLIAIVAYLSAAASTRKMHWIYQPTPRTWLVYIACGLLITVLLEYFATQVYQRWEYSDLMPVLPGIGVGSIPLLQWVILPPIALWLTSVFLRGLDQRMDSR